MHPCQFSSYLKLTLSVDVWYRFKRVGPNAMRGRGIGTARGRATIMRGGFFVSYGTLYRMLTLIFVYRKRYALISFHPNMYTNFLFFPFSTARSWSPSNSTGYPTMKKKGGVIDWPYDSPCPLSCRNVNHHLLLYK